MIPRACLRLRQTRGFELVPPRSRLETERKALIAHPGAAEPPHTRSKAIGQAKARGEDAAPLLAEVAGLGEELKTSEARLERIKTELEAIALGLPNLPDDSVPAGSDESGNVEQHRWGTPRSFDFEVRDHVDLGARHGWLDGEAAARLSGARFTVLRGQLARLHRALAQFMLDLHRTNTATRNQRPGAGECRRHARHRPAAQVRDDRSRPR